MFNTERTYGIEIEVVKLNSATIRDLIAELAAADVKAYDSTSSYDHNIRQGQWKIMKDASITGNSGFEIVSPPLKGDEGIDEVIAVLSVLRKLGARVDDSCGMHIHHDVSDLSRNQIAQATKLYNKHENVMDEQVPADRRMNNAYYCRSVRSQESNIEMFVNNRRVYESDARYCKVNVRAYLRHQTLEFRQADANLSTANAIAWIVFTQAFCEKAKASRISGNMQAPDSSWNKMLRELNMLPFQNQECEITLASIDFFKRNRKNA